MSAADTLRRAAATIQDEWGDRGDEGTAWHRVVVFHLAVADWLEAEAARVDWGKHSITADGAPMFPPNQQALAVATAYLGEQP